MSLPSGRQDRLKPGSCRGCAEVVRGKRRQEKRCAGGYSIASAGPVVHYGPRPAGPAAAELSPYTRGVSASGRGQSQRFQRQLGSSSPSLLRSTQPCVCMLSSKFQEPLLASMLIESIDQAPISRCRLDAMSCTLVVSCGRYFGLDDGPDVL